MKKNKIYITIALLLLGVYAIAKNKKAKSKIIVSEPGKINAYSIPGSTVYQYDLSTPIYTFKNEIKFEAGFRLNVRSDFNSRDQFRNNIFLGSISNKFKFGEDVAAGYVNLNGKKNKFSYQLGLRAESRTMTINVLNFAGKDSLNRKISIPVSLFPSAFVTYKINDGVNDRIIVKKFKNALKKILQIMHISID